MEIKDFMTKENLEMIGLAVMCDRYPMYWRGYNVRKKGICLVDENCRSTSFENLRDMVNLGKEIAIIMEFFETLSGECRIKDVLKYLEAKNIYTYNLSIQRVTAVCRRLCASGFLKQRYSDPYKITVKAFDFVRRENGVLERTDTTREVEVTDSLYSLA